MPKIMRMNLSSRFPSRLFRRRKQLIPLQKLRSGQRARIRSLSGNHDEIARLSELGLRSGADLTVVRRGSPCIIEIEGYRLCVRPSAKTEILMSPT